jgi:hypothetical protein
MNALDHNFGREAVLRYGDAEVKVLRQGDYVLCAVTGRRIPLAQLKYWSVSRQEAYAGPEQALARFKATGAL